ncbi:hypothetical protein [Nocardia tengchongensis]|uniref:hypothetical protein n=1 Tax=Nocardia tengchongensis TaxID=2055889 RepID=UPI0036932D6D
MITPDELTIVSCEAYGHNWSIWLPHGVCLRCGIPATEVLAWDSYGQLLGIIPTNRDSVR